MLFNKHIPSIASLLVSNHLDLIHHHHIVITVDIDHLNCAGCVSGSRHFTFFLPSHQIGEDSSLVEVLIDLQGKQSQGSTVEAATLLRIGILKPL